MTAPAADRSWAISAQDWKLGPDQPYRINVRYTPDHARVRVVGLLTAAAARELSNSLDVLSLLPARVHVEIAGVMHRDVLDVLALPRLWRRGAPVVSFG